MGLWRPPPTQVPPRPIIPPHSTTIATLNVSSSRLIAIQIAAQEIQFIRTFNRIKFYAMHVSCYFHFQNEEPSGTRWRSNDFFQMKIFWNACSRTRRNQWSKSYGRRYRCVNFSRLRWQRQRFFCFRAPLASWRQHPVSVHVTSRRPFCIDWSKSCR